MELDIFVWEKILNKSLIVQHIPTVNQNADILNKALSPLPFTSLQDKLKVFNNVLLGHPP